MAEIRVTHKAFCDGVENFPFDDVTEVVVEWDEADEMLDSEVCEAVFSQTNTYSGSLWNLIAPKLSPRRTHTALSVGDEVKVRGITYRCEPVGFKAVAVDLSAHK